MTETAAYRPVAQADPAERTGRALALPLVDSALPEARIAELCGLSRLSEEGVVDVGPGWSWVRVDFPWSNQVSLQHKAALNWTASRGPDARRMTVHSTAEATFADLTDWVARWERANPERRELLRHLQHADRSGQLVVCCSHETVSPEVNPNFAPPAVVYCVYHVDQGAHAGRAGREFFMDWRRAMVYVSSTSGRCIWHRTLPEGWSLHTVPLG
jgi:hypothetical protein